MKIVSLVVLLLWFTVDSSAQNTKNFVGAKPEENGLSSERLQRIDNMLMSYVESKKIPGAVALLIRNGKIVYKKAIGFSNVESKAPLATDNIFRIASQTKAITSLAVMMLFEEGKFLLDDPVSEYIPEFKNPRVLTSFNWKDSSYATVPAKSEITIRQLLTHTSGIDYAGIGSQEFKALYAKATVPSGIGNHAMNLADKIKRLAGLPLKHHPGEQYTYGLNTDVLGYLVEVVSGTTLDDFFKKRIFQPLGMNDTYFYLPSEKHSRLVTLYTNEGGLVAPVNKPVFDGVDYNYPLLNGRYYSGGAGLSSTVEDYAKFLQLFLNKGEYNGTRLLSRKTVELMLTDQLPASYSNSFGLGFGLETIKNDAQSVVTIGSFSWGGAFNTHYWADPKEKLIGILFTNIYSTAHWNIGDKFKVLTYQAIID
jgi:CubicO group peptidase (beta-lactamase class C family)